jgi:hypothetical protein
MRQKIKIEEKKSGSILWSQPLNSTNFLINFSCYFVFEMNKDELAIALKKNIFNV